MRSAIAYIWALPYTLVGLLLASLGFAAGGSFVCRNGVVEASGGILKKLLRGGAAMAMGHVILARDRDCLERSRSHELRHVRQFERWGPFTLPVYWIVAGWLKWRGFDPYLDHPFAHNVLDK
jgi:hypothetical protein